MNSNIHDDIKCQFCGGTIGQTYDITEEDTNNQYTLFHCLACYEQKEDEFVTKYEYPNK
jgi:hypothetical protein